MTCSARRKRGHYDIARLGEVGGVDAGCTMTRIRLVRDGNVKHWAADPQVALAVTVGSPEVRRPVRNGRIG